MATIDPAGAAASALYTPAVPVQTPPAQTAVNESERPVVETSNPQRPNDTVTQAAAKSDSNIGGIIDTTA